MFNNNPDPRHPRQPTELKDMDDVRRMFDGYDNGIRYMDSHIGMLMDELEKQGVLKDLIIIVSADHGENLGELGSWGEHGTSDQITHRIPLIISWPGVKPGSVDNGLHYNLDLGPTLAELVGKDCQESWDGQSFAPALLRGEDCGRPYLVLGQCAHVCQRSVRWDNYIYIRTYHDGFRLCDTEQVYDLDADPHEQNNLAPSRPDLCKEGVYRLNEWHDAMMASSESDVDPLWTVLREGGPLHAKGRLKEYAERLKNTGRDYAIPELKRRHPKEFE